MKITEYHAQYYAYEITRRFASDNPEKLTASLANAQVDLNPHQIDAALFAFGSPLSKGAILADEVGLGKTIEAGLVLSQKWAERKRKLLIIVPANLRKQWSQELQEKFFFNPIILEGKSFDQYKRNGNRNPFEQKEIVICSYHFAHNKADPISKINWDLVVIDEAHRLRNVHHISNKIAKAIKKAVGHSPKLLLTATPLQNSLTELYGLVSFVDEHIFGNVTHFKKQFSKLNQKTKIEDLKERLAPICKRTLRKQVQEYIKYTKRIPITQEFHPTENEQLLYDMVSEYLRRDHLLALPPGQRMLMTLVFRKLLASSSFAIAGALNKLIYRLKQKEKHLGSPRQYLSAQEKSTAKAMANHLSGRLQPQKKIQNSPQTTRKAYKVSEETDVEWVNRVKQQLEQETFEDIETACDEMDFVMEEMGQEVIQQEIQDLESYRDLAESITENTKGNALLSALETGFRKAQELGALPKVLVFTESIRTQNYLFQLLSPLYGSDKIVLFNGKNDDPKAQLIYADWLTTHQNSDRMTESKSVNLRTALVDYFKEHASIMIATDAAAEGVNLQFCSFVVNYDLPWNPQRIEQRIGRCHRYGQQHDVVVVNFLNKSNEIDQKVFDLLSKKFQFFDGVFGASDEVLGSVESGVDIERRILMIYQECRTPDTIQHAFDELQNELKVEISEKMKSTRKKLLEHFDEEVTDKLRLTLRDSIASLNKYDNWLWWLTKHYLQAHAEFEDEQHAFYLKQSPFPHLPIPEGPYRIGKEIENEHIYRIGHPLAQGIIEIAKEKQLESGEVEFSYTNSSKKISALKNLVNQSGFLIIRNLTISSFETENSLLLAGINDEGEILEQEQCQRFFSLPGKVLEPSQLVYPSILQKMLQQQSEAVVEKISQRNISYFEEEMEKLDKWSDDKRMLLRSSMEDIDEKVQKLKKQARLSRDLSEKFQLQQKIQKLEQKREHSWREYDQMIQEIERQKDDLLENIEKRMQQEISIHDLFVIKWRLV